MPSTSRARITSPTLVTPANSTAAVELASSSRTSARPLERPQADAQVGRAASGARARSALRVRGPIPASRSAESANEAALAPSRVGGRHDREQAGGERRAGGEARDRRARRTGRAPPAAARRARGASRPPARRARTAPRRCRPARRPTISAGSECANTTSVKARKRSRSAAIAHVRQPTRSTSAPSSGPKRIDGSRSGIEHRGDRPGGAGVLVGQQRQHHVGEPRAEARLCVGGEEPPARSVGQRGAEHSGPRGGGAPASGGARGAMPHTPCSRISTPSTMTASPTL